MFRLFIAVVCVAVVVYANPHVPTAEEAKAEIVAAGVSEGTADGILKIADKYKSQFEQGKTDRDAAKAAFEAFHSEVEKYIETQSSDDQTAYKAFIEKKKSQHQGPHFDSTSTD